MNRPQGTILYRHYHMTNVRVVIVQPTWGYPPLFFSRWNMSQNTPNGEASTLLSLEKAIFVSGLCQCVRYIARRCRNNNHEHNTMTSPLQIFHNTWSILLLAFSNIYILQSPISENWIIVFIPHTKQILIKTFYSLWAEFVPKFMERNWLHNMECIILYEH